jgi:RimJ/RimL family protein N-acetyltransferase
VSYWDAYELSYELYDEGFSGRGYTSEAVHLVVDWLFAVRKQHRIHLGIVPESAASVRVAQQCGFVLAGTVRGALFNAGRNQDILLYSQLRTDSRPWHA